MRRRLALDTGAEPRYWRSRQNRRVRKVRRARVVARTALVLACNAVLVLALLRAGAGTLAGLGTSTEFALTTIEVRGHDRVPARRIEAALAPWIGRSLLALDLVAAEARVEQDPWILDASVRRTLPGTLHVTVRERVPTALALVGGQVLVVDATGHRIEPLTDGLAESLPVLTGLTASDESRLDRQLQRGVAALRGVERASPTLARAVSELDLSSPDRVALRTIDGDPWILLDPERIERNLAAFLELRGEIERLAGPASQIDLRWQDRITLMPATQSPTGEDG